MKRTKQNTAHIELGCTVCQ